MNVRDKKYIKSEIDKAKNNVIFFTKNKGFNKELQFWKGYLNCIELINLQSKINYKN